MNYPNSPLFTKRGKIAETLDFLSLLQINVDDEELLVMKQDYHLQKNQRKK